MHFLKDPDESLDYGWDLVDWLSTGDTIASAVWTITEVSTSTDTSQTFLPGDVTPGSDFITLTANPFVDNDRVTFTNSGGALPAGITVNTGYHIIQATGTTIKLSLTRGGSVLSITDAGTGTHTIVRTMVNDGDLLATPITSVFVGGGTIAKTYKVSVYAVTASTPPRIFDRSHTIEIREK